MRRKLIASLVFVHALGITLSPGHARAQTMAESGMVISQMQAGGAGSGHASEEFIELYNSSAMPLSLEHWLIQYRSAGSVGDCTAGWSTKVTLPSGVVVPAHSYWLAAANGYLATADGRFAAGLPGAKGTLRLRGRADNLIDALAWGGSPCGNGTPAVAPPDGQSLERRHGANSNDNLADFTLRSLPAPRDHLAMAEPVTTQIYPVLELSEIGFGPLAFIELHNPTADVVQVSAYSLTVGGSVYHFLPANLGPDGYLGVSAAEAKLSYQAAGGSVMLADPAGDTNDETEWVNGTDASSYIRANGNWEWTAEPTMGSANIIKPLPKAPVVKAALPATVPRLIITELFVNPAAPLRDGSDEFVEIYNDGEMNVDLNGYVLRSGSSLGNKAVLGHVIISPGAFLALTATVTHLPLANDGGRVALFDPQGVAVGSEISYTKAPLGQSFARFDDGWNWTLLPTPGAANLLSAPAAIAAVTKVVAVPAKKPGSVKASSARAKALASPKAAKAKVASFTTQAAAPSGRWLLFVLGGLTMAYIAYEFRYTLQHSYYRCRRYLSSRRTPGAPAAGSDGAGADQ